MTLYNRRLWAQGSVSYGQAEQVANELGEVLRQQRTMDDMGLYTTYQALRNNNLLAAIFPRASHRFHMRPALPDAAQIVFHYENHRYYASCQILSADEDLFVIPLPMTETQVHEILAGLYLGDGPGVYDCLGNNPRY